MTGDAAQLAAGLIEGHLDETTELVRALGVDARDPGLDRRRELRITLARPGVEDALGGTTDSHGGSQLTLGGDLEPRAQHTLERLV